MSSYKSNFSDEMLSEAKQAFINGNYKLAEPVLQQMLLQGTRNPEVFQMLATIFYDKGQFNKAIKTFRRALEIDPTYTDASVGLSIILNDLGRYDEGKQVFTEARQLLQQRQNSADPAVEEKLATKHEELADLYCQCSRFAEAVEQLLKAQKLTTRQAEVTMRIADCFVKMGETTKATRALQGLLREYPNFHQARMKLGVIYYNCQNLAEATQAFESVLMRDPKHPEALKYLKMAQTVGITTLSP